MNTTALLALAPASGIILGLAYLWYAKRFYRFKRLVG